MYKPSVEEGFIIHMMSCVLCIRLFYAGYSMTFLYHFFENFAKFKFRHACY